MKKLLFFVLFGAFTSAMANAQVASFQNGVDGYLDQVDMGIRVDDSVFFGADTAQYYLDGSGDDTHALIRFDNVFGDQPGQIPLGSKILSANLDITTGNQDVNAPTNGPYYVSALLDPFDETTVYSDYVGLAAANNGNSLFVNNFSTRPAGGFTGSRFDDVVSANVLPLVQGWSDGAENYGFAVTAGTGNGWMISSQSDEVGRAPKLTVEYTTEDVNVYRFQDDNANGYASTSGLWLRDIDESSDAFLLDQEFLDGNSIDSRDSPDDQMIIQFDDVFGEGPTQVPENAHIEKAWLVLTTGNTSGNSQSRGPYDVRQMTAEWTVGSVYSDFGPIGPDEESGTAGPVLDSALGMAADSKQWLDITDAAINWQSGVENYGLSVQTGGTADGWQLNWLGGFDPDFVLSWLFTRPTQTFKTARLWEMLMETATSTQRIAQHKQSTGRVHFLPAKATRRCLMAISTLMAMSTLPTRTFSFRTGPVRLICSPPI